MAAIRFLMKNAVTGSRVRWSARSASASQASHARPSDLELRRRWPVYSGFGRAPLAVIAARITQRTAAPMVNFVHEDVKELNTNTLIGSTASPPCQEYNEVFDTLQINLIFCILHELVKKIHYDHWYPWIGTHGHADCPKASHARV